MASKILILVSLLALSCTCKRVSQSQDGGPNEVRLSLESKKCALFQNDFSEKGFVSAQKNVRGVMNCVLLKDQTALCKVIFNGPGKDDYTEDNYLGIFSTEIGEDKNEYLIVHVKSVVDESIFSRLICDRKTCSVMQTYSTKDRWGLQCLREKTQDLDI